MRNLDQLWTRKKYRRNFFLSIFHLFFINIIKYATRQTTKSRRDDGILKINFEVSDEYEKKCSQNLKLHELLLRWIVDKIH